MSAERFRDPSSDPVVRQLRNLAHAYQAVRLALVSHPEERVAVAVRSESLVTFTKAGEAWRYGFKPRVSRPVHEPRPAGQEEAAP